MIRKEADVVWRGDGKTGQGEITTQSKALSGVAYGFTSRFEQGKGTNPEELIAAAHASCFSMALAFRLAEAGFQARELKTKAVISMEKEGGGFTIKESKLTLEASIPEIAEHKFKELAAEAKANCPVSKLLNAKIILEAHLMKPTY
ncbi:MAG TPA: OsmC family protein [Oligoflexus sp.]|uniref:OsmC family protein n=1 Tax=Oligoflexus sp. TaxID=1971216 RepID=UPI002D315872|nr:OsmC family protein [Oligoflexus sp.]HYX31534.1 OsmC family protein [Oligoflexus sp.]